MPPSLPMSSSVAVATARILEAYLSNHKLTPAEAATLGGRIADALTGLIEIGGMKSQTKTGEELAPRRGGKVRRIDQAPPEPVAALPEDEPEDEPEPEFDAQPMAEPALMTADAAPDDPQTPALEPAEVQPGEAQPAEMKGLRKRKRPSRPRSRRGQGSGAAAASEATSGEDDVPHDDERHGAAPGHDGVAAAEEASPEPEPAPEPALKSEPVAAEEAEAPALPAKPRRAASRARRVTAS